MQENTPNDSIETSNAETFEKPKNLMLFEKFVKEEPVRKKSTEQYPKYHLSVCTTEPVLERTNWPDQPPSPLNRIPSLDQLSASAACRIPSRCLGPRREPCSARRCHRKYSSFTYL